MLGMPRPRFLPSGLGTHTLLSGWCFQVYQRLFSLWHNWSLSLVESAVFPSTPGVFFPLLSCVTCWTARAWAARLCNRSRCKRLTLAFCPSFCALKIFRCNRKTCCRNRFHGRSFQTSSALRPIFSARRNAAKWSINVFRLRYSIEACLVIFTVFDLINR